VRKIDIRTFLCPSGPRDPSDVGHSSYVGVHHDVEAPIDATNHGVFFLNSSVRYENITDGSAHTFFVGEKIFPDSSDLGWMSGTRATLRNTGTPLNTERNAWRTKPTTGMSPGAPADPVLGTTAVGGFSSFHPGGAQFAFGDGHVSFMSETMSPAVYQQYGHRADGKLLTERD